MTDNHEAAKTEAAQNEARAPKGWPVAVLDEGEVMIVGEKFIAGERYLRTADGTLYRWDVQRVGWLHDDTHEDAEAVPEDTEPDNVEPDTGEPEIVPATDPIANDLAEVEAEATTPKKETKS